MQEDIPYTITGQESTKALMNGRQFENVKIIYFVTPSGIHDSVEVPDRVYSPEYVHDAIMGKVEQIEAVQSLPFSITVPGA